MYQVIFKDKLGTYLGYELMEDEFTHRAGDIITMSNDTKVLILSVNTDEHYEYDLVIYTAEVTLEIPEY